MVILHTYSDDEAEGAADILDDCWAIDVDERGYTDSSTEYSQRASGLTGDAVIDSDYKKVLLVLQAIMTMNTIQKLQFQFLKKPIKILC